MVRTAVTVLLGLLSMLPPLPLTAIEVLFNKSPFSDPVEQRLLDLLGGVPSGSSVEICCYQLDRASVVSALTQMAVSRGIDVRIVIEKDNAGPECGLLDSFPLITVVTENRSSLMHNKFIVFDPAGSSSVADTVWTGSLNLTDNGITQDSQNVVVLQNPALAQSFDDEFNKMFVDRNFGTAKTGHTNHSFTVDAVPVEAWFSPKDDCAARLVQLIGSADHSIYFNIFTFTHPDVIAALTNKARQGIEVVGVCDAWSSANFASYGAYTILTQAHLPVYRDLVDGQSASGAFLLHHKFMVIDHGYPLSDPVVVTGSFNWTAAANDQNDENMIVIHDACAAKRYFNEARARAVEAGGWFPQDFAPAGLASFTAAPDGYGAVTLSWSPLSGCLLDSVVFRYADNAPPLTPSDGKTFGSVPASSHGPLIAADDWANGQTVYFSAFVTDILGVYSRTTASCVFTGPDGPLVSENSVSRSSTEIPFILPPVRPGRVLVYDVNGRPIRTIPVPDAGPAGWDLRDGTGRPVGPGLYYLAFKFSGKTVTEPVLVNR